MLRASTDHADLTFHALAFVPPRLDAPPLVRAASLHRPEWMRFATEHLPPGAVVPIERDAPLLGSLITTPEVAVALQRFATLHDNIAGFLATVREPLASVPPERVARASDLEALQHAPAAPVEILRAAAGLAAREFAAEHATHLRPFAERVIAALSPRLDALSAEVPALGSFDVRISATLGPRGRLVDHTVIAGTTTFPLDRGPLDTTTPLLLVAHEAAVRAAAMACAARELPALWSLVERIALDAAALAFERSSARDTLAAWRARLDLRGLAPRDASTDDLAADAAALLRGAALPGTPAPPAAGPRPPSGSARPASGA